MKGSELIINESGFEEEILGRIARDRQLGEDRDVAMRGLGDAERFEDELGVVVDCADDRVDLTQGDAQRPG